MVYKKYNISKKYILILYLVFFIILNPRGTQAQPVNACAHTPDLVSCTNKVDASDLAALLSDWGKDTTPDGDINCDGIVDVVDLGIVMSWWGSYGGEYWDNRCGLPFGTEPPIVIPPPTLGDRYNPPYPRTAVMHFGPGAPPEWYAKFDLIDFRGTRRSKPQSIHSINPNTLVFGTIDWNNGSFIQFSVPDEWSTFDSSGKPINLYGGSGWTANPTDFSCGLDGEYGIQRFNEWLPQKIFDSYPQSNVSCPGCFDGYATDGIWMRPRKAEGEICDGDIDLDYCSNPNSGNDFCTNGESWVREQWQFGWNRVITTLNSLSGNRPLILNSGRFHTEPEGFDWSNHNGLILENNTNYNNFSGCNSCWLDLNKSWEAKARQPYLLHNQYVGYDKTNFPRVRSALIAAMGSTAFFSYSEDELHHYDIFYDEYDLNLGYPTGEMQQIRSTGGANGHGVWVRFFSHPEDANFGGVVILNLSPISQTVRVSDLASLFGYTGPYYRFRGGQDPKTNNGQVFSEITLEGSVDFRGYPVGDGIILTSIPTVSVTDIFVDNDDESTSPGSEPAIFTGNWINSVDRDNVFNPWTQSWKGTRYERWAVAHTTESGATATFNPTIGMSGEYEIFEWHPEINATMCDRVNLQVNGQTQPDINQSTNYGQWNSLGTFNLNEGSENLIQITSSGGCMTSADAFKFVYQGNGGSWDGGGFVVPSNNPLSKSNLIHSKKGVVLGAYIDSKTPSKKKENNKLFDIIFSFIATGLGLSVLLWLITGGSISNLIKTKK